LICISSDLVFTAENVETLVAVVGSGNEESPVDPLPESLVVELFVVVVAEVEPLCALHSRNESTSTVNKISVNHGQKFFYNVGPRAMFVEVSYSRCKQT
jgi:hypothetical protein